MRLLQEQCESEKAQFQDIEFYGAKFPGAWFWCGWFQGAQYHWANLQNSPILNFKGLKLKELSFKKIELDKVQFQRAEFKVSILRAIFQKVQFFVAKFWRVSLRTFTSTRRLTHLRSQLSQLWLQSFIIWTAIRTTSWSHLCVCGKPSTFSIIVSLLS